MSAIPSPPAIPDRAPVAQSSSLGGASAIMARFQAFEKGEAPPPEKPANTPPAPQKPETPKQEAPKSPEQPKQEQPKETKEEPKKSLLPPEIPVNKEEPKKPDAPKVEQPKGPDGLTKEERAELVAHKEAVARELETAKQTLARLEEEKKRYEAKALAYDVRSSKEFEESIGKPYLTAEKAMKEMAEKSKLNPEEVFAAVFHADEYTGNAKLSEFMATMDQFSAGKFQRTVDILRDLDRKANYMSEHAADAWNAIQVAEKQRQEEAKARDTQTYRMAHEAVYKEMETRFPFLKESGDFLKQSQEVDFSALSPDAKAYYAQAGRAALLFNPILKAKDEEIASLKEALKKHQPHGPADSTPSTESTPPPNGSTPNMDNMTVGQRLVAQIAQLRGQ